MAVTLEAERKILDFLYSNPDRYYLPSWISMSLGIDFQDTVDTLRQLSMQKRIARVDNLNGLLEYIQDVNLYGVEDIPVSVSDAQKIAELTRMLEMKNREIAYLRGCISELKRLNEACEEEKFLGPLKR